MWVNVSSRKPESGRVVLVFRPQALTEDHTDKPLREACYNEEVDRFDCYHQPTQWLDSPLPDAWNSDLDKRQCGS